MVFTLSIALVAIVLLVGGQTMLKLGLNQIGGISIFGGHPIESLMGIFGTPWILLGFGCYGISAILWLDVLSKLEFSLAFPLVSMTYIFSLIIGHFLFHEAINVYRIIGVSAIVVGLFFVVRSGS